MTGDNDYADDLQRQRCLKAQHNTKDDKSTEMHQSKRRDVRLQLWDINRRNSTFQELVGGQAARALAQAGPEGCCPDAYAERRHC